MTSNGKFRYNGMLTRRLTVAMDRFLKSREGSHANLWNMVIDEVYRPIGVFHAPVNTVFNSYGGSGVPDLGGGMFPTYQDIVKIGSLLQNGGRYHGRQLLSERKTHEALYRTEIRGAPAPNEHNPEVSYYMSLWQVPTDLDNCMINVSMMSGVGGKIATLQPSGTVAFYLRNSKGKNFVQELTVAVASLQSECG